MGTKSLGFVASDISQHQPLSWVFTWGSTTPARRLALVTHFFRMAQVKILSWAQGLSGLGVSHFGVWLPLFGYSSQFSQRHFLWVSLSVQIAIRGSQPLGDCELLSICCFEMLHCGVTMGARAGATPGLSCCSAMFRGDSRSGECVINGCESIFFLF